MTTTATAPPRLHPPTRIHGIDIKRAEVLTRRLLLSVTPTYHFVPPLSNLPPSLDAFLNGAGFSSLHPSLDPATRGPSTKPTKVPPARAARKRTQIANIVALVAALPKPPRKKGREMPRLLDMCGGCGHVGLVLAALMPTWRVTVVDTARVALGVAERRAREAALDNFDVLERDIGELDMSFDVVVALHGCGGASDVVMAKAMAVGASMVVVPCCVGGVVAKKGNVTGRAVGSVVEDPVRGGGMEWENGKSDKLRGLLGEGEFERLARAADFGEVEGEGDEWRRVAKMILEWDRAIWVRKAGYQVRVVKMRPMECSPKNDVLVAWKGGDSGDWEVDGEMGAFVKGVKEGSVIRGLGVSEVWEVEEILRKYVCEGDKGEWLGKGLGKRKRKVVHAVAESMGLYHESFGKGKDRFVCVKRTLWWPIFFDYYVGVGGPEVERVCDALSDCVPEKCLERRSVLRGNPRHVTVVRPPEISKLAYHYKRDKSLLLSKVYDFLYGSTMRALGVGRVRQKKNTVGSPSDAVWGVRDGAAASRALWDQVDSADANLNEAYFVVLEWPAANALRRELGLAPADFHITLGFSDRDIHTLRKNRNTLIFRRAIEFSPWTTDLAEFS